jgi:hypothetical protein
MRGPQFRTLSEVAHEVIVREHRVYVVRDGRSMCLSAADISQAPFGQIAAALTAGCLYRAVLRHPLTCTICGAGFPTKAALLSHIAAKHDEG